MAKMMARTMALLHMAKIMARIMASSPTLSITPVAGLKFSAHT